jgi:hypothetical protein
MNRKPTLSVLAATFASTFLAGCTQTVEAPQSALFNAGGTVTTGVLLGVYESDKQAAGTVTATSRYDLRADSITVGTRCTGGGITKTPVVTSAAVISDAQIVIAESKVATDSVAGVSCGVQLGAGTIPRCDAAVPATSRVNCFALDGTVLSLYIASTVRLTKVADTQK